MSTEPITYPTWPASWPDYRQDRTPADRAARAIDAMPDDDARALLREVARIVADTPPSDDARAQAWHRIAGTVLGPIMNGG